MPPLEGVTVARGTPAAGGAVCCDAAVFTGVAAAAAPGVGEPARCPVFSGDTNDVADMVLCVEDPMGYSVFSFKRSIRRKGWTRDNLRIQFFL